PGQPLSYSYADLARHAATLAHHLVSLGVMAGDRVGVLRSQGIWTAAAHVAIWKIGAISIPLFKLFGPDALRSRVVDAGAKVVVTERGGHHGLDGLNVFQLEPDDFALCDDPFETAQTTSETPAVLIYTSGTTGAPKGALHAHRVLTGHFPGVEMSHDFLGQDDDRIWTPADWAWIGGLFDVLMPGLALGVPVVAARLTKFTPDAAKEIIETLDVKNVFFPPTALRMIKAAECKITGLRSVASGGEPLGAEMLEWARDALGVTINEFYGQTECNMVVSSCQAAFPVKNGAIGKPVPGFDVCVIDDAGSPTIEEGDIAIRCGAVSMMIEYWNNPVATQEKFRGDWMLTGDRGIVDQGYIRFVGRDDDVITSAGYRIGPAEIEDCLLTHPAVATVGVVGKPDPMRTEIVKAYVVLKPEFTASDELRDALKMYVKERLAKHAYPREISFLDELPMTVTGKVIRKELRARAENEGAEQ
ncbi:MAG: AMP-dependent synthetase, partial [Rhodobacteraceae bacterium]|nr:AMP-dependent synthetase [Paracoccaceae bacterium]